MIQVLNGFTFALAIVAAALYGHDVSMTEHGFIIQGYLGAAIPVAFTGIGAVLGMSLMYNAAKS